MRRRDCVVSLAATLLCLPSRAFPQQAANLRRIGVLVSASPPHPFADAFHHGLSTFGYTDGKNIAVDFLYTDARPDRATEYAIEFARSGVDIIVAHFTPAVKAAMKATRTIPIVMAPAGAPLEQGLVDSLARPGGNVTGLSAMESELGGKRLQLLRELIPNLVCVAVLAAKPAIDGGFGELLVKDFRGAAAKAAIRLAPVLVDGPSEFEMAFATMSEAGAQVMFIQGLFEPYAGALIELATKYHLALMSGGREPIAAGGLVSMSANYSFLYERAAFYVDKLLRGATPAELPVEQPTEFQIVLNIKKAHALGLTPSPTLLAQISEIID